MYRLACAAPNCKMRTYDLSPEQLKLVENNYSVSFHKFPKDEEKRNAWIAAANQIAWNPDANSSICSLHFKDNCYDQNNQLFEHAVPTIFFENFRTCLKDIIKTTNMDVELESTGSDNEDLGRKNLKNVCPIVSDQKEIMELSFSDDDFEIECEVIIDENEENEQMNKKIPSLPKKKSTNILKPDVQRNVSFTKPLLSESKTDNLASTATLDHIAETPHPSHNNTEAKNPPLDVETIKTKSTSSDAAETTQILYSMIENDSIIDSPLIQPATKTLVCQLLNIVKMANAPNASRAGNSVPNTYIITTKQELKDSDKNQKTVSMETSDIVTLITKTVQEIKDGVFKQKKDMNIICASPAIFLIKNVVVNNFDSNMNSVYVITSENLIPHLAQFNTKNSKSLTAPKAEQTNEVNVCSYGVSYGNISLPKHAQDDKTTVTTVMNSLKGSAVVTTKTSTIKPNTAASVAAFKFSQTATSAGFKMGTVSTTKKAVSMSAATSKSGDIAASPVCGIKTGTLHMTRTLVPISETVPKNPKLQMRNLPSRVVPISTSATECSQAAPSSTAGIKTTKLFPTIPITTTTITHNQTSASSSLGINTGTLISTNPKLPVSVTMLKSNQTIASPSTGVKAGTILSRTVPVSATAPLTNQTSTSRNHGIRAGTLLSTSPKIPVTVASPSIRIKTEAIPSRTVPVSVTTLEPHQTSASPNRGIKTGTLFSTSNSVHANQLRRSSTSAFQSPVILSNTSTPSILPKPATNFAPILRVTVPTTPPKLPLTITSTPTTLGTNLFRLNLVNAKSSKTISSLKTHSAPASTAKVNLVASNVNPAIAVSQITKNSITLPRLSFDTVQPITQTKAVSQNLPQAQKRPLVIDLTSPTPPEPKKVADDIDEITIESQEQEIADLEKRIINKECEINAMRKKIASLKKRYLAVKPPLDTKPDERLLENLLKKYFEPNAIQFFIAQVKVAGKAFTQFRWTDEDKLFALGLLYKNPSEYHLLCRKYDLPSDKTLTKFVAAVKRAESNSKN